MQFIIGIDIGTTHTKAVVVTTTGEVCAEFKEGYPFLQSRPGYHEQDPERIFNAVEKVLNNAFGSVKESKDILCVCFSAAMHSLIAVDKTGNPICPMMTWADTRSIEQATKLKNSSNGKLIYDRTGTPIHPMSPLCKIIWLKENSPELHASSFKFISIKEYVWFRFFGEYVTDHAIASSGGLFDIETLKYCDAALHEAGITAEKLSEPVSITYSKKGSSNHVKTVKIDKDTAVVIGASDGFLANLGSAAVGKGEAALTIGTSGAVRSLQQKIVRDKQQRLFNYAIDEKTWLSGGAINNGGIVLKWFIDSFYEGRVEDINQIVESAMSLSPGTNGLIFLPYVYGERAPVWDASARGVFFGIGPGHTKVHFLRAVLEGIAFSLLQILEALEENSASMERIHASGGFIESAGWLKIVCDVLGKKIIVSRVADASAMGAVYLGLKALGKIVDWEEVKQFVRADEEFTPDAEMRATYLQNYAVYCKLYDQLKENF